MVHYADVVFDNLGVPVSGATVTVYDTGTTTKPVIYSDDGITTTANPLTTDAYGRYNFYVGSGRYDLVAAWGTATYTLSDVLLSDEILDQQPVLSSVTANGSNRTIYTTSFPTGAVGKGRGIRVTAAWYHEGSNSTAYNWVVSGSAGPDTFRAVDGNTDAAGNANISTMTLEVFNNAGVTNSQTWRRTTTLLGTTRVATGTTAAAGITSILFQCLGTSPDKVTPEFWLVELL